MADDKVNLDNFLGKVDEIGDLIKNLVGSKESGDHKDAIEKADTFLKDVEAKQQLQEYQIQKTNQRPVIDNTGFNRTVINKKAFEDADPAPGPELQPAMNQEAFMAVIEQDAKERAARKKRLLTEANVIKEKGNEAFKSGNYEGAIELYSEGLTKVKDHPALWTNRAQCYMKLQQYELALADCEWALRASEKFLKAYIHKGKALAALNRFDEALECFNEAIEVEPSKEKAIEGYMRDVELQRQSRDEERFAQEAFDAGDMAAKGIIGILEKLNRLDQLPYYYSGGLRLLAQAMNDTKERTLFRTSGGLSLAEKHPFISKCLAASPRSLSQDEVDMCAAMLETYTAAATDNEENQRMILDIPTLPSQILRFLESKWKATHLVKQAAIIMLHVMSENQHSRGSIVTQYDMFRLLSCVFTLMRSKNQTLATKSVGLLNNLALDKKFKIQLRDEIDELLPAFETAMTDDGVQPCCISTVTNLCADTALRHKLRQRKQIWQACCIALEKHTPQHSDQRHGDILYALLGLLMNLTLDGGSSLEEYGPRLCTQCEVLLRSGTARLEDRSCGVLAHTLPHSVVAVHTLCQHGLVPTLLNIIQNIDNPHLKPAVKALTVCTQHSSLAREAILSHDKGLKRVYDLLKLKDEQILGNVCLCLSHCVSLPQVSTALANTNVLMDLLVLARDGSNTQVRHNCAILIAKLTQTDHRHLERLRELDGLGILHDVLKHVKE